MKKGVLYSLKRLTISVLALVIAFTMAACGGNGGGSSNGDPTGDDSQSAPVISTFTIDADMGAAKGKVNEAHKLNWDITGKTDSTVITVTVKKGDPAVDAAATDYEYVEQSQKITFKTVGHYAVTLKAANGTKASSKSAAIDISEFADPVINGMPADSSVYVDDELDYAPTVTYDTGDSKATENTSVTLDGSPATEGTDYTIASGKFTPKKAGEYKVTFTATSAKGKSANKTWTLTASPLGDVIVNATAPSAPTENDRYLVERGVATDFTYTVQGYVEENFNVSVTLTKDSADKSSMVEHTAADKKLTVTATEDGDYTLTITFTHKTDADNHGSATWNIRVKADINAPEFGLDPFGGTWTNLKPNIGMRLYFDATDDKVSSLTYANVTYTVESAGTTGANIVSTGSYANYPYLIATAAGTATVKITVSDGINSASATKDFTVEAAADHTYDGYFKTVYTGTDNMFSSSLAVWVDGFNATAGNVPNAATTLIVTKNGLISSRGDVNQTDSLIGVAAESNAFTIEFDFTLLYVNADMNTLWFTPYEGTNALGNIGFNWTGSNNQLNGSFADAGVGTANSTHASVAKPAVGTTVKLRLQKSGTSLTISLSTDGNTYNNIISATMTGDKTIANVFIWCCDAGDYMIENIKLTK